MTSFFSGFGYSPPAGPPIPQKKKVDSAASEVDSNQNPTKLFKRIEERAWAPAMSRLERSPNEAKTWVVRKAFDGSVTWRRLPIHQACISKPSAKVVLTLLQSFPNSARQVDSDRRLAVHHACANGASLDVVKHLLMAHPDSVNAQDIWFKTPFQTIMDTQNPDPGIVTALQKGPQYYRMKVSEARARMRSKSPSPSSQNKKTRTPSSNGNKVNNGNDSMVAGMEEELGKFSERLAASFDQETTLKNRIAELEKKEADSEHLKAELYKYQLEFPSIESMQRDLEHFHRVEAENQDLKSELNDYRKDLLKYDDVKRSEDNLRRRLENLDIGENERVRSLEEKLMNVTETLHETEGRLRDISENTDSDLYAMKRDLKTAIEDAEIAQKKTQQYKEEQVQTTYEVDALRTLVSSHEDVSNELRSKLEGYNEEREQLAHELEELDKHCFSLDTKLKESLNKLQQSEKEKEELINTSTNIETMKGEITEKTKSIGLMEYQLKDLQQENDDLKQVLNEIEHNQLQQDMSFNVQQQNTMRELNDMEEELTRARRKQTAAEEDRSDMEKRLKEQKHKNDELEKEFDVLKRREIQVTREVNGINQTIEDKVGTYRSKFIKEQGESQRFKDIANDVEERNSQLQNKVSDLNAANDDLLRKLYQLQDELGQKSANHDALMVIAEKENLDFENRQLREKLTTLTQKFDELLAENALMIEKSLENKKHDYEFDQMHLNSERLKESMVKEIEEKEDMEARVAFLMEEIERLEDSQTIPKEINTAVDVGSKYMALEEVKDVLMTQIEDLEASNESLCVLLEEQKQHNVDNKALASEAMAEFEDRLSTIEDAKNKEINEIEQVKNELEIHLAELNIQLNARDHEIKELISSNQMHENEIKLLKMKTESESKNNSIKDRIRDRLEHLESMSRSSSRESRHETNLRTLNQSETIPSSRRNRSLDDSSQISGITGVFSSTPSPSPQLSPSPSPAPTRRPSQNSQSRSKYLGSNLDTRSYSNQSRGGASVEFDKKYDKKLIAKYKNSKKKGLDGIFPSSMTVSGISLGSVDDTSIAGIRSLHTSPSTKSYSQYDRYRVNGGNGILTKAASNEKELTTKQRIMAILKE